MVVVRRPLLSILFLLFLFSAALPVAAVPGQPSSSPAAAPSHEPIDIDSDAEMALPDNVSGNGVREGSGTQEDPWVIRNWRIEAPENGKAISISGVTGYFEIRNVSVHVNGGDRAVGIELLRDDHAKLEDVRIEGTGSPVRIRDTTLTARSVNVTTIALECWEAEDSNLDLQDLTIRGLCGSPAIVASNSNVVADGLELRRVANGVRAFGVASQVEIRDATITATNRAQHPMNSQLALADHGLVLNTTGIDELAVEDVEIHGFASTCLDLVGPAPPGLELSAIELHACGRDRTDAAVSVANRGQTPLVLRDVEIRNASVGVRALRGEVQLQRSVIRTSDLGLLADPGAETSSPPKIEASKVEFDGNSMTAKAIPPGSIRILEPTGDTLAVQGPVEVSSPGSTSVDRSNEVPTVGLLPLIGLLGGIARWTER